ncbi:MAG TPA: DUF2169 domain-containing protein [Solirubrobacteraceae bacterium]|nr:DUF2169 domain-containing protein [Solirubrobacteraceae bacterium]
MPHLRGGERVELVNLAATGPLVFDLPKHYFTFATHVRGRSEEHRARLTSVFIEPEAARLSMVWQTSIPVRPADLDYLDETIVAEKAYLA